MNIEDIQKFYASVPACADVNYLNIPKTFIPSTHEGASEFNQLYRVLILDSPYELRQICRTPSGGVAKSKHIRFQYDVQVFKSSIELTYIGPIGMYRFIFNGRPEGISGLDSFKLFHKRCKDAGVDLTDFAITNGEEIKATIPSPMIELYARCDKIYTNVHHLDINSAFMAGIAEMCPQLFNIIEDLYRQRKSDANAKHVLTHTYGFMQSKWCQLIKDGRRYNYALAHLSKGAIVYTNEYLTRLINQLKLSGRRVLSTNTDGIWYAGDVYHGEGEGLKLGEWRNDHTDCTIRFKSKGSYEYIENGVYCPVVRGRCGLDSFKSREKWSWGDIYNAHASPIKYQFIEGQGILATMEEDDENL